MTRFMRSVMQAIKKKRERVHKLCQKARCDRDRIPRGKNDEQKSA